VSDSTLNCRDCLFKAGITWTTDTDILHLDMMGSHLVVLSSSDVAIDLLERRSVMYSDRVRESFVTFKTPVLMSIYR
jgi:hypothetical protein